MKHSRRFLAGHRFVDQLFTERPGLRWRIVGILLAVSLLPLLVVGIGTWAVLGSLLEERSLELQRNVVQSHARTIDLYLAERLRALELVARGYPFAELSRPDGLQRIFDALSTSYDGSFVDLGIIDAAGAHLAYVGPYNLKDKNYAGAEWFHDVMRLGSFVSDVFLGFRQVPHCVIAVKLVDGERVHVLRATINSDKFDALVRTANLGITSDAFIVNTLGAFQTPSKLGRVLERSPIATPLVHPGVHESRVTMEGRTLVQTTAWLNHDRWMLVVRQELAEITAPVHRALALGALVALVGVLLIVFTTFFATWHLVSQIDRANEQRDELSRDLLRSAKLASVGELSSGLAHQINNPLAIITADLTNIGDFVASLDPATPDREAVAESVRCCQRQVERCGGITAKMLQFGRKGDTVLQSVDVGPRLEEISGLMRRQAEERNVQLECKVEPGLPRVVIDPTELEQIVVNLINNSLHAIAGRGSVRLGATRKDGEVLVTVADTGSGIAPENMDKIFQPFFTTKAPGQGTGLGLSVCYGIVRNWGGSITVNSALGAGTVFTVHLPIPDTEGR